MYLERKLESKALKARSPELWIVPEVISTADWRVLLEVM